MKEIRQIFVENLIRYRYAAGFKTVTEFSKASGMPYRTYQDIERGGAIPQDENLVKICRTLRIQEYQLFEVRYVEDSGKVTKHRSELKKIVDILSVLDRKQL